MKKIFLATLLLSLCPLGSLHAAKSKKIKPVKVKKASSETIFSKFWNGTRSLRSNSGIAWYRLSDVTVLDVGSNSNEIANNTTHIAPFMGIQAGVQCDAPSFGNKKSGLFYAGFGLSYAKRKEAIEMDFYDGGETSPSFVVRQNVNDLRLTPRFEWEFFQNRQSSFALTGGIIMSFKTLDKLKIFEKNTGYYIGQRLTPRNVNILGQIGFAVTRAVKEHWALRAHYHYTRGHVKYKTKLTIETPHVNAAQHHQDALQINETDINLSEKPTMKLRGHEIGWSLIYEF